MNAPGYLVLSDVKIRSFSRIWNPQNSRIITKAHLKSFLEKAFPRNFLFYIGAWLGFFLDEKCFTPLAYKYVVDVSTINTYLFKKEKEESGIDIYYREDLYPYTIFIFDASLIYKTFSHLISEEKFSLFLREQFYELRILPAWHQENLIDCKFFSSKEELDVFLRGKELWEPKDKRVWDECLSHRRKQLEQNREEIQDWSNAIVYPPQIEVSAEIEEYLKK